MEVEGIETAWKLECFPNGKQKIGEDTAGAVSVFLYPANTTAINRQFSFAIGWVGCWVAQSDDIDHHPADRFVNEESSRVMKGKGDHCFRDNQNGWGWLKLVTHQTLRYANDKLLPSDCLNILCVMKFRGEKQKLSELLSPHFLFPGSEITTSGTSKPTSLLRFSADQGEDSEETTGENGGFLQLLQTGELADVDVVVGDRTFQCHKAILGAKSPFFKAAFVHDMKEKATGKITIDGDITNILEGQSSNSLV